MWASDVRIRCRPLGVGRSIALGRSIARWPLGRPGLTTRAVPPMIERMFGPGDRPDGIADAFEDGAGQL
jgi:hypothetical protein